MSSLNEFKKLSIDQAYKHNRPGLSSSSIKTYASLFRSMSNKLKIEIDTVEEVLENFNTILDYINNIENVRHRKTKLASVISLLNNPKLEGKERETLSILIEKLRYIMNEDLNEVKKIERNQTLTNQQAENFLPWSEIMEVYNDLKEDAEYVFSKLARKKDKKITSRDFLTLRNYVLLSLYTLIPPRRSMDYTAFKVKNIDPKTDNYLLIDNDDKENPRYFFVFNQYKNAGKLGPQRVDIPKELFDIIDRWLDVNPYDYLLVNKLKQHNKPISVITLTNILNKIFNRNLSTTLLRHSYLTHKYGKVDLKELSDDTTDMGNSEISRSLKYVVK